VQVKYKGKALLVTSLDSHKWRYSKCPDLYLYLPWMTLQGRANIRRWISQ